MRIAVFSKTPETHQQIFDILSDHEVVSRNDVWLQHDDEFDVAIIDVNTDVGVVQGIKEVKRQLPATKILIASTNFNDEILRHSILAGMDNYIHKPIHEDELLKTIEYLFKTS